METHSSILAWEIPWTEVLGWLQLGVAKSGMQLKQLSLYAHILEQMSWWIEMHGWRVECQDLLSERWHVF